MARLGDGAGPQGPLGNPKRSSFPLAESLQHLTQSSRFRHQDRDAQVERDLGERGAAASSFTGPQWGTQTPPSGRRGPGGAGPSGDSL